jgi:hypothetical protein
MDEPKASATLELCDETLPTPTSAEDFERAIDAKPHDEDWYLTLTVANDDFMDVSIDAPGLPFHVTCWVGESKLEATSTVDAALLKELLASFLAGDERWRDMAKWATPPKPASSAAAFGKPQIALVSVAGIAVILGMIHPRWAAAWVLSALPIGFAALVLSKLAEAKRAATWTRTTAQIAISELVTKTQHDRQVSLPRIEYDITVQFNKYRGNRISIGEIMADTPEVQAALKRYPVGANVPAYYDPKDPRISVLERDLPEKFGMIWILVAVVAAACWGAVAWIFM